MTIETTTETTTKAIPECCSEQMKPITRFKAKGCIYRRFFCYACRNVKVVKMKESANKEYIECET